MNRIRQMLGRSLRAAGAFLLVVRAWLRDQAQEIVLVIGLVLVAVALWPKVGQLALLVPGVVLIWYALPARPPFMEHIPPSTRAPRPAPPPRNA